VEISRACNKYVRTSLLLEGVGMQVTSGGVQIASGGCAANTALENN